ncbi:nuclear transport factor 2 family protein [Pedobacter sp. PAMC26386]|nr:nuclear transport factor 2 family protein [Pedobacter sp. PAMC26386]
MKDYKLLLKEVFTTVLESTLYNEELINRYFSQNYIQQVDGKTLYFEGFKQHMKVLKNDMLSIQIDIQTLVQEGNIVFSNHMVSGTTKENRKGLVQVIAEFRFEGDQIAYCNELTHLVAGSPQERDLGSRI